MKHDPLHKSFRVFSALFSSVGVLFAGASAAAIAYPDGLPYSEYKLLVQGAGAAGAALAGTVAGGLAAISKAKESAVQ